MLSTQFSSILVLKPNVRQKTQYKVLAKVQRRTIIKYRADDLTGKRHHITPSMAPIVNDAFRSLPPVRTKFTKRRVVVTGMGLVTPLGVGVKKNWERLLAGESGIGKITRFDVPKNIPVTIAGQVPYGTEEHEFDMYRYSLADDNDHRFPRATQFAIAATEQALSDSKWFPTESKYQERTGVVIGCALGNMSEIEQTHALFKDEGYKKVNPFFVPRILSNIIAAQVSIEYGLKGLNHTVSTACATGGHAIGDAYRFIQDGYADVIVAGASDTSITPLTIAGFAKMQALNTAHNETPHLASRPFDSRRRGFVLSEGAGILILEDFEHAAKRGAPIYAEIRGYGLAGDASHITKPDVMGDGARRAMNMAMDYAGIRPRDIGYLNAHATGTPLGDLAEIRAIRSIWGMEGTKSLNVSSTKGHTGHLLGAAGAVEAIYAIMAMNQCAIPHTLNHNEILNDMKDVGYVMEKPKICEPGEIRAVLSNSFGFGGTNTSLLFTTPPAATEAPKPSMKQKMMSKLGA